MILMPEMFGAQAASWHGVLDLHDRPDCGWTLVCGQMVHIHCAERGSVPPRATTDVDTVIDVRADHDMLKTFTNTLIELGFSTEGISGEGIQHRWVRSDATIDVLLPDGVGERAASRLGATRGPTIPTPGGTQALRRSESVPVNVEGRDGFVRRPNLVGALVMKAAADTAPGDAARGRHRFDFATLAALVAAHDFRDPQLNEKDRQRLRDMLTATRADLGVISRREDATEALNRLERAARL